MVLLGLAPVLLTPLLYNFHLLYESQDIACCQLPLQLPVECGIYSHAQHPSSPSPTLTHHFKGPSPTPLPSPQQRATPRLKQGPFSHVHPPISPLLPPPPPAIAPLNHHPPPQPPHNPQYSTLNTSPQPPLYHFNILSPESTPTAPSINYPELHTFTINYPPSLESVLHLSKRHSISRKGTLFLESALCFLTRHSLSSLRTNAHFALPSYSFSWYWYFIWESMRWCGFDGYSTV
jgi:hypothetical protein